MHGACRLGYEALYALDDRNAACDRCHNSRGRASAPLSRSAPTPPLLITVMTMRASVLLVVLMALSASKALAGRAPPPRKPCSPVRNATVTGEGSCSAG